MKASNGSAKDIENAGLEASGMLLVGTYLHAVQLCLHLLLVMQEALFQEFHTLQCPGVNCKSHTMLKPWQAQAQWPATQVSMYCKFPMCCQFKLCLVAGPSYGCSGGWRASTSVSKVASKT